MIAGLLVVFGGAGYFGFSQYQSYQREKTNAEKRTQELVKTQQEKDEQANEKIKRQDSEVAKLKEAVEILKNTKQEAVVQTIIKEIPAQRTDNDISSVIQYWRPRIAYIECSSSWRTTVGSGLTLAVSSDKYTIWTNKHVTAPSGGKSCKIIFPDSISSPLFSIGARINPSSDQDFAIIDIPKPNEYMANIINAKDPLLCFQRPSIGDQIAVLGYPAIGSQADITATEGIVSGYDGDYFITSAKVEQGNSGGAAILVKDNCYLGIPTFAQIGVIESLARVLDWHKFKN